MSYIVVVVVIVLIAIFYFTRTKSQTPSLSGLITYISNIQYEQNLSSGLDLMPSHGVSERWAIMENGKYVVIKNLQNGGYISANPDSTLKFVDTISDWELWTMETKNNITIFCSKPWNLYLSARGSGPGGAKCGLDQNGDIWNGKNFQQWMLKK